MTTLIWLRFVMGLGLGAEIVVGYATLPIRAAKSRGRWLSFMAVLVVSGLPITAAARILDHSGIRLAADVCHRRRRCAHRLLSAQACRNRRVGWRRRERTEEAEVLMHAIEQEAQRVQALPLTGAARAGRQIQLASLMTLSLLPRMIVAVGC